jgi:hypothetical protein
LSLFKPSKFSYVHSWYVRADGLPSYPIVHHLQASEQDSSRRLQELVRLALLPASAVPGLSLHWTESVKRPFATSVWPGRVAIPGLCWLAKDGVGNVVHIQHGVLTLTRGHCCVDYIHTNYIYILISNLKKLKNPRKTKKAFRDDEE